MLYLFNQYYELQEVLKIKILRCIRYNLYSLFSLKKSAIIFTIYSFIIFNKIYEHNYLNKFITVFSFPTTQIMSDILGAILFNTLFLVVLGENFVCNYINIKNFILFRVKNIKSWMIGILLSYIIAIMIYFFVVYILSIMTGIYLGDSINEQSIINNSIIKFGTDKIVFNLICINILINYIYILNFIWLYMLNKNFGLTIAVNIGIMFLSYIMSVKAPSSALYLPTCQGCEVIYNLNNYCFYNSYILIFVTLIILLGSIFLLKKTYLE